eukprot:300139-Prorocentrum_minimum.AAC.3
MGDMGHFQVRSREQGIRSTRIWSNLPPHYRGGGRLYGGYGALPCAEAEFRSARPYRVNPLPVM